MKRFFLAAAILVPLLTVAPNYPGFPDSCRAAEPAAPATMPTPKPAPTSARPTPKPSAPISITVPPGDMLPGEDYDLAVVGLTVDDLVPNKLLFIPPDNSGVRCKLTVQWLEAGLSPVITFRAKSPGSYRIILVAAMPGEKLASAMTTVIVKGDVKPPDPPVPPPPEPDVNPYKPDPQFRAAVDPVTRFPLSPQDSDSLSQLYGVTAVQAVAKLGTTVDLRSFLVSEGGKLGLKDKYKGLGTAVDAAMTAMLGNQIAPLDKTKAAAALQTLGWAVWEAGRDQRQQQRRNAR